MAMDFFKTKIDATRQFEKPQRTHPLFAIYQNRTVNQHELNSKIEALIRQRDDSKASYTLADKAFIAQYEGAGGLSSKGASGQGLLYEFYTPEWLCAKMWELAFHHGYSSGAVLETACATGRLFKNAPKQDEVTGFEINPISARIAQILYPKSKVFNAYFETAFLQPDRFTQPYKEGLTWLKGYPFSLVISNPPYGKHTNQYSSYFSTPKMKQMEFFFMYYGLLMLRSGGLLVYLTSSNIMRNGISYQAEKDQIGNIATLVDAYRLPPVFRFSQVPTDIIVLKKN